jgi:hypothetical protein
MTLNLLKDCLFNDQRPFYRVCLHRDKNILSEIMSHHLSIPTMIYYIFLEHFINTIAFSLKYQNPNRFRNQFFN